jgi:transposase-like protein
MSKFSVEIAEQVVSAIKAGAALGEAADLVGVTRQTIWNWRQQGRKSGSGERYDFDLDVRKEEAKHIAAAQRTIHEIVRQRGDLKAASNTAQWLLERKLPNEYGRHDKLTVDHGNIAQQFLDYLRGRLDADTYDRVLAALVEDAGGEPAPLQLVE